MTMLPEDLTLGTGRSIGRYFGLVSAIPTLVLTGYLTVLVISGAWTSRPNFGLAFDLLSSPSVGGVVAVLAAALVTALILHSLQFTIVQLLEGYWGGSALMRHLRRSRTASHIDRFEAARRIKSVADDHLDDEAVEGKARLAAFISFADAEHVTDGYPDLRAVDGHSVDPASMFLPTRLGNVLRRFETRIGRPFGLDALSQTTQLALVASPDHVAYLQDQRSAMDLAARMCACGLIASVATFVMMLPWDVWMLLTAVPYAAAYVAYRGTLVAARHYGDALEAVIALNRFRLYRGLHLRMPTSTDDERALNAAWNQVRTGFRQYSVFYDHPPERDSPGNS